MRTAFLQTVLEEAASQSDLWLITGDLGYSVLEPFRDRFPERFVNVGVAEQNMIGVAAGLALAGKTVIVYSIVNFPVMRALEQIRNDVAYHGLPVLIAVVGGGLVYGAHGYTHHGAEDIGVMRLMPNMRVIVPADPLETQWATRFLLRMPGPAFLRMARGGEPVLHKRPLDNQALDHPLQLRIGADVTIAASGPILRMAMEIADAIESHGIQSSVFSVPSLVPLDVQPLFDSAEKTKRLLVLEDHGRGGLGTIVAEQMARRPVGFTMHSVAYNREPVAVAGRLDYLRTLHGLDRSAIESMIRAWVRP